MNKITFKRIEAILANDPTVTKEQAARIIRVCLQKPSLVKDLFTKILQTHYYGISVPLSVVLNKLGPDELIKTWKCINFVFLVLKYIWEGMM